MTHKRKLIRNAVVDKVNNQQLFPNVTFYPNRPLSINVEKCPLCFIYLKNETSEEYGQAPKRSLRRLEIVFEYVERGTIDNIEDSMEVFASQLENVMNYERFLPYTDPETQKKEILLKNIQIASVDRDFNGESNAPIGQITITYMLEYITTDISNLYMIDDLSTIFGKTNVTGEVSEQSIDLSNQ